MHVLQLLEHALHPVAVRKYPDAHDVHAAEVPDLEQVRQLAMLQGEHNEEVLR